MIQLVIPGMMRTEYLTQVREALARHHPDLYDNRIESHDTEGLGMAKGVQRGFDRFLATDADYCYWVEEDMLPLRRPPVERAVEILEADPALANVVFAREPWSDEEHAAGSVIAASCAYAPFWKNHGTHTTHDHIFSLNPCLIPRRVMEMGWPEGPLGVGNESGMTRKCLDAGYRFAFYGTADDPPYFRHIGVERGAGWKL